MPARHLRFVAAPLALTLCFVIFLLNDQRLTSSSAASGAGHGKPLPSLGGDAAIDHLKREGLYDRMMKTIEADRYRITRAREEAMESASEASLGAVNHAQHLRAEFSRDGTLISPLQKSAQPGPLPKTARRGSLQKSVRRDWQMRLSLLGYGYGDVTPEVAARLTRTDGNRIETQYVARASQRPVLSEWHVNRRAGLEHGFTITERPGVNLAGEPLRVRMKVKGDLEARLADGGSAVVFVRRDGREVLRYDHLVVEDAYGQRLGAWMEAGGGEVAIVVDEAGAAYPLTIDPLFTQVRKLAADDGAMGDLFGHSVSISGDMVVVGAPNANSLKGAAYIFERNQGEADEWGLVEKLTADDGVTFDQFGWSVSISFDTVVVGAFRANSEKGAAYIFARNEGGADQWDRVAKLTADDGAPNHLFGYSVSISFDTVVVGAPQIAIGGPGAAYIFTRNQGGKDEWDQVAKLAVDDGMDNAQFGWSVSISGDTVVVGAPQIAIGGPGAAYIFARNEGGKDEWDQVAMLTADDGALNDQFGVSVSISNDTVVVGAPQIAIGGPGAAYIFTRNQGGKDEWDQVQKLPAQAGGDGSFGISVGISGDTVVVGANDVESFQGAVYIFARNQKEADKWGLVEKLATDDGATNIQFGRSVSISDDTIIVGAPGDDTFKGSAYTFTIECDEWVERRELINPNGDPNALFGFSVSISGDTVVVGDTTLEEAYIFARNKDGADQWGLVAVLTGEHGDFGCSVSISSDTVVVGAHQANSGKGAAFIFERNQGGADQWEEVAKLVDVNGEAVDGFGLSVSISGDTVVVGAPRADSSEGAAFIFARNKNGADQWGSVAELSGEGGNFGLSVSISNDTVVVGAPQANGNKGAAYIFARNKNGADEWGQVQKLTDEDGVLGDGFGYSVSISFDTVVVGVPDADSGQGAAYIFERNVGDADEWGQVLKLPGEGGGFGALVGISSDTVVVGASLLDSQKGAAYIFARNKNGADEWGQVQKLTDEDGVANDQFGFSVGISSDTVIVGALQANAGQGAAHIYARDCAPPPACAQMPAELPAGTAGTAYSQSVAATPEGDYSYSLIDGLLPDGFSLDTTTGLISGTTNIAGTYTFTIQAEKQDGCIVSQDYTLKIECALITFSPDSLPNGTVDTQYSATVTASPEGSYTYTLTGDPLPPGLSLNSTTGLISGTPTTPGPYTFTIQAQNEEGCFGTMSYTIVIIGCMPITLNPSNLPNGPVDTEYSVTVSASPEDSYTYSLTGGTLPPGLLLNPTTGLISGTPTTDGSYTFTIQAQNEEGCIGSRTYTIVIGCAELLLAPESLANGTAGLPYSQSITVTSPGSFYYSLLIGMLPPGYSLNPTTGIISGMTNIAGSYNFTIRAQSQDGCIDTESYTLVIGCPQITLNPASLANGAVGTPYSATVSATPATTNYTFAVTADSLPPGLSLNATTGKIAGLPAANGEFSFTITATGFGSCSASRRYTIIIGGGTSCPMITLPELPGGTVGKIYSHSAAATPAGAYTYSLTEGSLPPGVTLYGPIGLLYGYPTVAGPYSFTITATNSAGCSKSMPYSLTINSK